MTTSRPLVRVLLVAAGGAIGTAARLGGGMLLPESAGIPWGVLVANVLGAFLIGVLAVRLPGSSERRLFLGTGVLGGFTTYSAFAVGSVALWSDAPLLAVGYALGSLVLGVAAAFAGMRVGRRRADA